MEPIARLDVVGCYRLLVSRQLLCCLTYPTSLLHSAGGASLQPQLPDQRFYIYHTPHHGRRGAQTRRHALHFACSPLLSYGGKMTCRGERPTSREDRLVRCEPTRDCVLRVNHLCCRAARICIAYLAVHVPHRCGDIQREKGVTMSNHKAPLRIRLEEYKGMFRECDAESLTKLCSAKHASPASRIALSFVFRKRFPNGTASVR